MSADQVLSQLSIQGDDSRPKHRQISDQIQIWIEDGDLPVGERLPSSRDLADLVSVNRSTVVQAYQNLLQAGFVSSGVGQGTFVSAPDSQAREPSPGFNWSPALFNDRLLIEESLRELMPGPSSSVIHFGQAVPDPRLYPLAALKDAMGNLSNQELSELFDYAPAQGYEPLRSALRERLEARGIDFETNDIVILNGSQQALHMVASLLLGPESSVIVENPTFTGALDIFTQFDVNISSVALDDEGLDIDDFERVISRHRHQLLYTIPTFQNPTGLSLSLERRKRLMELVAEHHIPVLEDDWLGELRGSEDAPPLKTFDTGGHVILFSTISKVLVPGLRVGWMVAPREPLDALVKLKSSLDICTNVPSQAIVAAMLKSGFVDEHIAFVRDSYRSRREALLDAIAQEFPEEVTHTNPPGGMTLWVNLPQELDPIQVFDRARAEGVIVSPGSLFGRSGQFVPGLRLCYSRTNEEEIRRGMAILGRSLKQLLSKRSRTGSRPHGSPMV